LHTFSGHAGSIKAIATTSKRGTSIDQFTSFITASKDQTLRVWERAQNEEEFVTKYVCYGHIGSVEAVSVCPSSQTNKFCSGSWDKDIKIWDTSQASESSNAESKKNKKRKVGYLELKPVSSLSGHSQCVSGVVWLENSNQIISGSWDHSIRVWDIESASNVNTLNGNKVVTGLSFSEKLKVIATAHADNVVRVWDPRTHDGPLVSQSFNSHKGFVYSVSWHPVSEYLLLSSSADTTVKIWDIRSKIPLHTINSHTDKVLCVDWAIDNKDFIVSGGADSQLRINSIDNKN